MPSWPVNPLAPQRPPVQPLHSCPCGPHSGPPPHTNTRSHTHGRHWNNANPLSLLWAVTVMYNSISALMLLSKIKDRTVVQAKWFWEQVVFRYKLMSGILLSLISLQPMHRHLITSSTCYYRDAEKYSRVKSDSVAYSNCSFHKWHCFYESYHSERNRFSFLVGPCQHES